MAVRKQRKDFFVYVIQGEGGVPLYVGKGCGNRHKASARKHGGKAHIIEWCATDDEAFERERFWISDLAPANNLHPGGNGSRRRARSRNDVPRRLVGRVSPTEWRRQLAEESAQEAEIERVGSQRHVAQFLCRKLNEANCEEWGVSKVDLFRLREVAHG